ncbi:MAG TPA: hypothetical protein VMU12_02935 [Candidatus Paceibacterota bacterium]|nr:hypothetical protein [Candidatus Paceibacterota bacterium]
MRYAETFGIEPHLYEREIPDAIKSLSGALHRFREGGGTDDEIRNEFTGTYPAQKIEADLAEVHRLQRAYEAGDTMLERKNRLYTLVLELIVCDCANEWFPDCTIWRSYSFDDYKRQTDLFMDVPDAQGMPHTLALDVTSSREAASRKIDESLEEFRSGRLHDVDYFASDTDPDRPRGRQFMPRMVVGAAYASIASLARLYGTWMRAGERSKDEAMERIRNHELGGQLYTELLRQLDLAHTYMRRNLKDTPTYQVARRETLKQRAHDIDEIRRTLRERFAAWKKTAAEYEKKKESTGRGTEALPNGVLDAILDAA